jgi:hypothetical protein
MAWTSDLSDRSETHGCDTPRGQSRTKEIRRKFREYLVPDMLDSPKLAPEIAVLDGLPNSGKLLV